MFGSHLSNFVLCQLYCKQNSVVKTCKGLGENLGRNGGSWRDSSLFTTGEHWGGSGEGWVTCRCAQNVPFPLYLKVLLYRDFVRSLSSQTSYLADLPFYKVLSSANSIVFPPLWLKWGHTAQMVSLGINTCLFKDTILIPSRPTMPSFFYFFLLQFTRL